MSRTIRIAGGSVLGMVLLALALRNVDPDRLGHALQGMSSLAATQVVLVAFLTYGVRAWRLGTLLSPLVGVPYWHLVSVTYVAYTAGLVVPRANEVLRAHLIARRHGLATSAVLAPIALERVIDVAVVLVMFGLGLRAAPGGSLDPDVQARVVAGGSLAALLAWGVVLTLSALHLRLGACLRLLALAVAPLPKSVARSAEHTVVAFASGLGVLRVSSARLALLTLQSMAIWSSVALGMYLSSRAFGIALPFPSAFVVLGFVVFGVAVPTPAGVGGFHVGYVTALTVVYGAAPEAALGAALVCHALTNSSVLVVGLWMIFRERLDIASVSVRREEAVPAATGGAKPRW